MQIISSSLQKILTQYQSYLREIFRKELGLAVKRTRFLFQGHWYPLKLILFEGKPLGTFDPAFYTIGLNKDLFLTRSKEEILNILRHEVAHYIDFLVFPETCGGHDRQFREICKKFHWGEEVYRAREKAEDIEANIERKRLNRVAEKIKKLLALSSSDNPHEAQLATLKANEYLLKNHIESPELLTGEASEYCVHRVKKFKKISGKLKAIASILETFYVAPVFNYGRDYAYLEITGNRTHIEIALYLADHLDRELDLLYKQFKKENPMARGVRYQNSFFLGVAEGYLEKHKKQVSSLNKEQSKALVRVKEDLETGLNLIYGRRRSSGQRTTLDVNSLQAGKEAGQNLSLRKGVQSSQSLPKLLSL